MQIEMQLFHEFVEAKSAEGQTLQSLEEALIQYRQQTSTHEDDSDEDIPRGVLPVPHKRQVMFEKSFRFKIGDLPRWKPEIHPDQELLEDPDD